MRFEAYETEGFYDELFDSSDRPRPGAKLLVEKIKSLPEGDLLLKQKAAEAMLLQMASNIFALR